MPVGSPLLLHPHFKMRCSVSFPVAQRLWAEGIDGYFSEGASLRNMNLNLSQGKKKFSLESSGIKVSKYTGIL